MTADELITKRDLENFKQELLALLEPLVGVGLRTQHKWLKNDDVKQLLKISNNTLANLRVNGSLPFTKIGGIHFYKQEDVDKMLSGPEKKSPKKSRSTKPGDIGSASSST